MTLGMVAFWALLIAVVVWLVRGLDRRQAGTPSAQRPGPEQVLAERFARGEIDEQEFNDRLAALRGDRRPALLS
jgi:putative membrane protein